jgi:hypothetical protein
VEREKRIGQLMVISIDQRLPKLNNFGNPP